MAGSNDRTHDDGPRRPVAGDRERQREPSPAQLDPASDADVGLWLVGARGTVGVSAIVGALALARREADGTGLATARPPCNRLDLPDPGALAIGGHEVRDGDLVELARALQADGGPGDRALVDRLEPALRSVDRRIRPGTVRGCGDAVRALADEGHVIGGTGADPDEPGASDGEGADEGAPDRDVAASTVVEQLRADLARFRASHDLEHVVVVNLASPEPPVRTPGAYQRSEDVERAVEADDPALPASALYAHAALREGCPYANCAPSVGASLPGLRELAVELGVPHAGDDVKTGAALVESAFAPLFAGRNLEVHAWEGQDVLAGGPAARAADPGGRANGRDGRASGRDGPDGRANGHDGQDGRASGRQSGGSDPTRRNRAPDRTAEAGVVAGEPGVATGGTDGAHGGNGSDGSDPAGSDVGRTAGSSETAPRRTRSGPARDRSRPAPETRDGALAGILEDLADSRARIDHARTVGNWTRSWDYVHLEGFLGAEMTVEFTWDGAEAPLAAPTVLDLARLLVHAEQRGEAGVQRHLAAFFASPLGVEEHALEPQLDALAEYVDRHAGTRSGPARASD